MVLDELKKEAALHADTLRSYGCGGSWQV